MKNFARLVRFAWPYRVRFGLSLGCAGMVALLWGANIGAVYPLLQILFDDKNCQIWVAEKIEAVETDIQAEESQLAEIDFVARNAADKAALKEHFKEVHDDFNTKSDRARALQQQIDGFGRLGTKSKAAREKADLAGRLRESKIAESRLLELNRDVDLVVEQDRAGLDHRRVMFTRRLRESQKWLARYEWIQPIVNKYLPHDGFKTLVWLLTLVLGGVALKGAFLFLQEVLVADINQLSLFDIRNRFFRRTLALDLARFTDQGSAELTSRFTNDMDSLSQGFNTLFTKVIREPLRILSCLSVAMWMNWRLTFLTLVLVPVSAATTYRAGKIMKRAVRRSLESMSNIYKILQESFQGIKVVKAFTMERHERRRFFLETKSLYKKSVRVAKIDALSDPVLEMLALSTVSIALLAGSFLVLRRTLFLDLGLFKLQLASQLMTIEDLLTLYALLAGVSDPVRKLANVHSRIQRAAAAADRICALMDREPEVADKPDAIRLPRPSRSTLAPSERGSARSLSLDEPWHIEFEQVAFSYNGREPVLRGVDLKVRRGERIAIVGPNGCGKSTLMNLLPRFWDVQSGAIRVEGHDVRDLRIKSLREQIGLVTQETVLFDDTLANNISYGSRSASRGMIEQAAQRAYAHAFISCLPDGYDTLIGERGTGLSGGQRQRIALARAMLRDPAILILDEATSAVDIQDEALIRKAIEEFSRNRTTFLITHSLSSLQFVDRIILMDAGRIEAVGTDAELRRNSPLYRRLHEIQFQRESA